MSDQPPAPKNRQDLLLLIASGYVKAFVAGLAIGIIAGWLLRTFI